MDAATPDSAREMGLAAYAKRDWAGAHAALKDLAEAGALRPDEDIAFASASALCGQHEPIQRAYERGIAGLERDGRPGDAAVAIFDLARHVGERTPDAVRRSWMTKAERLATAAGDHRAVGHVALAHGFSAWRRGEFDRALEFARQAEQVAQRHGDVALEAMALNRIGRVMIRNGELDAGQQLIDRAMELVTIDQVSALSGFVVYCNTIDACADVQDYRRAAEWTTLANEWCTDHEMAGLGGICRVHRAEVLWVRGAWELAARELKVACADLERMDAPIPIAWALHAEGVNHTATGNFEAAEAAFRRAHALGLDPQPGLAQLWLQQGKASAASTALVHALAEADGPLARAKFLPTLVEAALELREDDRAEQAVAELEAIALRFPGPGLCAEALEARGSLQFHSGAPQAVTTLRKALRAWQEVGAPYRAARLRGLLADAHDRHGERDAAELERGAAQDVFQRLGATMNVPRTRQSGADGAATFAAAITCVARVDDPLTRLIDGKLELLRKLGEGGMGRVYAARHRLLGRDVAVKLLRAGACDDPQQCARLLAEAMASAQVRHPNVVEVFDAGVDGGAPYLVLELLDGESLGERLQRTGPLALDDAREIIGQALAGVGAAHERGIVHRDLKPDNLFLLTGPTPRVKVLDFGIAKLQDRGAAAATRTGALTGTPYYMAPEQIEGARDLDPRVDVYALGVVLFELLTGKRPFVADGYGALLLAIMTEPFPSCTALAPDLPEWIDAVIQRATHRDRSRRFASAQEFAAALRAGSDDR